MRVWSPRAGARGKLFSFSKMPRYARRRARTTFRRRSYARRRTPMRRRRGAYGGRRGRRRVFRPRPELKTIFLIQPEVEVHSTQLGFHAFSLFDGLLAQGVADNQRIGDSIFIKTIECRWFFVRRGAYSNIAPGTGAENYWRDRHLRRMIVKSRYAGPSLTTYPWQNLAALPIQVDFVDRTTNTFSEPGKRRVLRDKIWAVKAEPFQYPMLDTELTMAAGTSGAPVTFTMVPGQRNNKYRWFKMYWKFNKYVKFSATGFCLQNDLTWFFMSDDTDAAGTGPSLCPVAVGAVFKIRYYDN